MHYGHPDVFDRIFHITRGGISKASRVINISEDIYAGKYDNCGRLLLLLNCEQCLQIKEYFSSVSLV